ncbi:hypothetical protein D3C75_681580 [compost metagenome]
MFSTNDLAQEEARLVSVAQQEYGDFFNMAEYAVRFLWRFCYEPNESCWIFVSLLGQVQKGIHLALLSNLRKHDVQTNMLLRYSLEAIPLSLYSLVFREEKYFAKYQEDGTVLPTEALKASYKWLEKKFPQQNGIIKYSKDSINKFSAHGNIIPASYNTDFSKDGKVTISFFDKDHSDVMKLRLWWISDICYGYMNMVAILNEEYPSVKLVANFQEIMSDLFQAIKSTESQLRNTDTFKKFL